jgi:hypothetical protein
LQQERTEPADLSPDELPAAGAESESAQEQFRP